MFRARAGVGITARLLGRLWELPGERDGGTARSAARARAPTTTYYKYPRFTPVSTLTALKVGYL